MIRDVEGIAITEADLLYPGKIAVWVQGNPHHREHVASRDAELEKRLKAIGYRVVQIWPERMGEGLRDLALRLKRPDLVSG